MSTGFSPLKLNRQRAWNVIRDRMCFRLEDFGKNPCIKEYVAILAKAGYITTIGMGEPVTYRVVRNTGVLAPMMHGRRVRDANLYDHRPDVAQLTWNTLRMLKQCSLFEIQTATEIGSRSKISEYCGKLFDAGILSLVDPPATVRKSRFYYSLPKDLGPIAPIPTKEGVWDCNQSPEVCHEYHR